MQDHHPTRNCQAKGPPDVVLSHHQFAWGLEIESDREKQTSSTSRGKNTEPWFFFVLHRCSKWDLEVWNDIMWYDTKQHMIGIHMTYIWWYTMFFLFKENMFLRKVLKHCLLQSRRYPSNRSGGRQTRRGRFAHGFYLGRFSGAEKAAFRESESMCWKGEPVHRFFL